MFFHCKSFGARKVCFWQIVPNWLQKSSGMFRISGVLKQRMRSETRTIPCLRDGFWFGSNLWNETFSILLSSMWSSFTVWILWNNGLWNKNIFLELQNLYVVFESAAIWERKHFPFYFREWSALLIRELVCKCSLILHFVSALLAFANSAS